MPRPFLLAQLSDPHLGAEWFDDQSAPRLTAAVEAVRAVRPQPEAVLVTGDIADHATGEEYEQVRELLASLDRPLYVLPGHHPPLVTGIPAWDEIGLRDADRQALAGVIERHPQVRRLVGGHVHRAIGGELAGRSVLVVPSTYVQARLNLAMQELELSADPAGFAVHAVVDGELVSHIQPVQSLR